MEKKKMIALKDAYDKAKVVFPDYSLVECIDIGKAFVFYFSDDIEATPGIPYIIVDKNTGNIDYLTIPPIKNLKMIRQGKRIDIKQFT